MCGIALRVSVCVVTPWVIVRLSAPWVMACVIRTMGLGGLTDDLVPLIRPTDYLKGDVWLIQRESPGVYRLCS
ncbi:hypothetical protein BL254_18660 [Protofrankia sp. BMG5.30]|nr:hypothetical protein BL254_18660 [Protofrankia sp. BMG5.30]